MKYALFLGCSIPSRVFHYESSARLVLGELGVELVDLEDFTCCGPVPLRSISFDMFLAAAGRNLALAEAEGLDILCLCSGCFSSLSDAGHQFEHNPRQRDKINDRLSGQGLSCHGGVKVKHFLQVLYEDVGLKAIRERIVRPFNNLNIAVHYGCHTIRPGKIVQFDASVPPVLFEQLVEATGATSVEWAEKMECCGGPLLGVNENLALDLCEKKLASARDWGADFLCTSCPFCQVQFDAVQKKIAADRGRTYDLPSVLYSQLLGLAMDLDREQLGLDQNRLPLDGLEDHLSPG